MPLSAEDKLELLDIDARLDWAVDAGDVDGWVALFTLDGALEASYGSARGSDELKAMLQKLEGGFSKGKRHTTSNHRVEGDGDEARLSGYLVVFEREETPKVVATATYTDTYVRIGGAWKVRHRKLDLDRNGQDQS